MPVPRKKRISRTKTTPVYAIGTVARLTGIPVYTLRWIERRGLVAPARTGGRRRLFCDEELELLQEVAELMEEGVNLPGIRIILTLKRRPQG